MAVRIRMKRLGRRHRPFYRICAMDSRSPRDGKVIEELGYYDPMVRETDARAILQNERIDYWISQGALPTEKVKVLIDKYGTNGRCAEQQKEAIERLASQKPVAPPPQKVPLPEKEAAAEPETQEVSAADQADSETPDAAVASAASEEATASAASEEATASAASETAAETETLGDVLDEAADGKAAAESEANKESE